MSVTVTGESVDQVLGQILRHEPSYAIKIRVRKGSPFDYMDTMETGCIVNAVGMPGQEVERSFKNAGEAMRYIRSLFKIIDDRAREQKKERLKKQRESKQGFKKKRHDD